MNRVSFLVDGFNLYHSLREAQTDLAGDGTRWLDLKSLLGSYLSSIGANASLEEVHCFSALALHRDARRPGQTQRHRHYIECLQATAVHVHLGKFKRKSVYCKHCKTSSEHYEEKETDVAISVKLLELLHADAADTVVLVTGDTDLAPAVRTAQSLFPAKRIAFLFPYKRKNSELEKLVATHVQIRKQQYLRHQFQNPFTLPSGRQIPRPSHW